MRLVMICEISDGFTYSCTDTHPIEYESQEAALVDFEISLKAAKQAKTRSFVFAGFEFHYGDFYDHYGEQAQHYLPEILTIDEWYNQYGSNGVT